MEIGDQAVHCLESVAGVNEYLCPFTFGPKTAVVVYQRFQSAAGRCANGDNSAAARLRRVYLLRGFLGKMLFSNEAVFKPVNVLSGGEKVRCMFSRMMMFGSNMLIIDQPTDHLDLESITAVNNGLADFKGVVILASHDHEIMQTVANRIIEITPNGVIDRIGTYEDYLEYKKNNK